MDYEGNNQIVNKNQIESLRAILEKIHHIKYSDKQIEEISESIIVFYEVLAGGSWYVLKYQESFKYRNTGKSIE